MIRKRSCSVRRGAVGKVSSIDGDNSLAAYSTKGSGEKRKFKALSEVLIKSESPVLSILAQVNPS